MRWQARFEGEAADRYLPYLIAVVLFVVWFTLALARERGLGAGTDLAGALQSRWLILHGHSPNSTITGSHLLAQHLPLGFYPLAWLTRVLPAVPTLLGVQSLSLAAGVVPLWRMGRRLAELRVGAVLAIIAAYALSPTLNDLNLADFHAGVVAVAPLLTATYLALRSRWVGFALASVIAMLWSAELGLVVAGLGAVLWTRGERRMGTRAIAFGFGWTFASVVVLEPRYGSTGFIAPGAFQRYGTNAFSIGFGMLIHPIRVAVDLLAEGNVRLLVVLLAPLLFLPVLAPRLLAPALPLQALYLIADVRPRAVDIALPLTVFAFVAATFALNRLGRRGVERVLVDRRVLIALVVAALGFFATEADSSPYRHPWEWAHQDAGDHARRDAADAVGAGVSVRAVRSVLPIVAERRVAYELTAGTSARDASDGVDRIVTDTAALEWSAADVLRFATDVTALGFRVTFRQEGVTVYARVGT
ncbi:MAG: DUF2079 domain-containing protein [Acidimicrobiales bacterium]